MALLDALSKRMVRERARFIEDYEDNIDQARLDLGKLFRIEDYPSKEALRGKFGLRYRIIPVPDADHFMAKLASDDTDRVKRDIESQIEERLHDAVGDLYRRLGEAVERVSERSAGRRRGQAAGVPGLDDRQHPRPGRRRAAAQHLRRRRASATLRAGEGEDRRRRAGRAQAVEEFRSGRAGPGQARRRRAGGAKFAGYFAPAAQVSRRAPTGGCVMPARVRSESAQRVSGCVTALLREQPFFGSLALRLPVRADMPAARRWRATGGRSAIRHNGSRRPTPTSSRPRSRVWCWPARSSTTRGASERDPERWQRASQLVTHGLLRDAGFTLPPDAEAWDGISVEEAYDRLPEPDDDESGDGNPPDDGGGSGADAAGTPMSDGSEPSDRRR